MATHSSILAWEIPRTEEPGGLQSAGLPRAGHDGAHMHRQRYFSNPLSIYSFNEHILSKCKALS